MARATDPACRAPRAPSTGAAARESSSRCAMGSLAPPLPRPDQPQAARRVHTAATHQRVPQPPCPHPWPVSAFTRPQTRDRGPSTQHRERQEAPNCLLPLSPPSQALAKRFSRAPGPLHILHRSPASAGQAPRTLGQDRGQGRHHRQPAPQNGRRRQRLLFRIH